MSGIIHVNGIPVTQNPRNNHSDIFTLINGNTIARSNKLALINAARLINHVQEQNGVTNVFMKGIKWSSQDTYLFVQYIRTHQNLFYSN